MVVFIFVYIVRLLILASHPHPHVLHLHGTFSSEPRVNSLGLLLLCAHSASKASFPFFSHHTSKLLASVATLPAHAGHPVGFLLLVLSLMVASHPHPHVLHLHGTFSSEPHVNSSGFLWSFAS